MIKINIFMKTILITGGAGFIGSHACLLLLQKGFEIIVIDSYINSHPVFIKKVIEYHKKKNPLMKNKLNFFKGDLRNINAIEKVFSFAKNNRMNIKAVLHLAGLKSVKESIKEPMQYWEANFIGTFNLVNVMNKYYCHTLVHSSSACVYGNSKKNNLNELDEVNPTNPYGKTKLAIENYLKDVQNHTKYNWRIANLRYFNPVGAHPSGIIGDSPRGEFYNIFPLLIKVASKEASHLKIFGRNWPTIDGTCIRDYVHIMDLVEGHISVIEFLLKNDPQYITINLGRGEGISLLELVNKFCEVNRVVIPLEFCAEREGDVARLVTNNALAKEILNWSPKRGLDQICKDSWNWKLRN